MSFQIEKEFTFSAAHCLSGLPADHPCGRVHGHNYTVKLVLSADEVDEIGFVRDYRDLDRFKKWLDDGLDHQYLGDPELDITTSHVEMVPRALPSMNPTAENMAKYFYTIAKQWFPELIGVGVSETPKTWAWYQND